VSKSKRKKRPRMRRVMTSVSRDEYRLLLKVRRFVSANSGIDSDSAALRFLICNWSSP
jgi:hypothetical protein